MNLCTKASAIENKIFVIMFRALAHAFAFAIASELLILARVLFSLHLRLQLRCFSLLA